MSASSKDLSEAISLLEEMKEYEIERENDTFVPEYGDILYHLQKLQGQLQHTFRNIFKKRLNPKRRSKRSVRKTREKHIIFIQHIEELLDRLTENFSLLKAKLWILSDEVKDNGELWSVGQVVNVKLWSAGQVVKCWPCCECQVVKWWPSCEVLAMLWMSSCEVLAKLWSVGHVVNVKLWSVGQVVKCWPSCECQVVKCWPSCEVLSKFWRSSCEVSNRRQLLSS